MDVWMTTQPIHSATQDHHSFIVTRGWSIYQLHTLDYLAPLPDTTTSWDLLPPPSSGTIVQVRGMSSHIWFDLQHGLTSLWILAKLEMSKQTNTLDMDQTKGPESRLI